MTCDIDWKDIGDADHIHWRAIGFGHELNVSETPDGWYYWVSGDRDWDMSSFYATREIAQREAASVLDQGE